MTDLREASKNKLYAGGSEGQLLPALRKAITQATDIEIAVSFIRTTGLNLIIDDLSTALQSEVRGVQLTLLTSDYMNITDPKALKSLMLLKERGADIRVYECKDHDSFHMKAYIFVRSEQSCIVSADAFIGSSNISSKALTDGLEWNYHIDYPGDSDGVSRLNEIRESFQRLLAQPQVKKLSFAWIEGYQSRYNAARKSNAVQAIAADKQDPEPEIPTPKSHQRDALNALARTRDRGNKKGLVVLATGMGKTYLSAFDAAQVGANRILFVAHREEILLQAEAAFLAVMPSKRVGSYAGQQKDVDVDMLFASVQTLGRMAHLDRFSPSHFDYIVVDEFHHAAAQSYARILEYFKPKFLLGLTATPDRTDGSDILRLCDHNLVYRQDLFDGIRGSHLCPFDYYGIFDDQVDYQHIPWRNSRFDPRKLSTKLATEARARHALSEWKEKAQTKTLAFCVSQSHADHMAAYFNKNGVAAASIHTESKLSRSEALEKLQCGDLSVLFSVDLFNEGVDLPQIDTVMMLRPTESRILFLQQLGRGLRSCEGKEKLVVMDFVGNHHSFLNRPAMLFGSEFDTQPNRQQLIEAVKNPMDLLPDGCYVNYDLKFIRFLESLVDDNLEVHYLRLKEVLKRRPTLKEFWQNGAPLGSLRRNHGSWWEFVDSQGDASPEELSVLERYAQWFQDLTVTRTTKCYKLVLLATMLDNQAMGRSVTRQELSAWARQWFLDNPEWHPDLPDSLLPIEEASEKIFQNYWVKNPVKYWCTPEKGSGISWFSLNDMSFQYQLSPAMEEWACFQKMTTEILDWRLVVYRKANGILDAVMTTPKNTEVNSENIVSLPFYPDIKIACGHFKTGRSDVEDLVRAPSGFGRLSPSRHFIARASGNSMNGGKSPVTDGDYLLFEQVTPSSAGSISNQTVAIERQDAAGDNQYLLRRVLKNPDGSYTLRANNSDYEDLIANESMATFARLKGVLDPLEILVGKEFKREDIPPLFGAEFNPGNWNSGHVVLKDADAQVLLVTLNKQGKADNFQFHDYFIDTSHFHWQSQNSVGPHNAKGRAVIDHQSTGSRVFLFVREHKLTNGKAAPFHFYGEVVYERHEGSKPMNVIWRLLN